MLIVLNKPYGVICQFSPDDKHPTLKNYIPYPKVYPAGRLDTDSEGLLLLTDDGKLQSRITSPRHLLPKTYWVQVEGIPDEKAIQNLQQGVQLKDFRTLPAKVQLLDRQPEKVLWARNPPIRYRKNIPDSWLAITIHEGKNRQVRRMCAAVGFPCLRLVRVQIGKINLLDLQLTLGEYRIIAPKDLI